MRRSIIGALIAVLAIAGVVALTAASGPTEMRATGEQASAAAREAIEYAGGEWATLEMPTEPGVVLKFHVIRRDGTTSDVLVGEDFHVIRAGTD
jgi:hypothetical protein